MRPTAGARWPVDPSVWKRCNRARSPCLEAVVVVAREWRTPHPACHTGGVRRGLLARSEGTNNLRNRKSLPVLMNQHRLPNRYYEAHFTAAALSRAAGRALLDESQARISW